MLINEVAGQLGTAGVDTGRLLALVKFLMGRAKDTNTDQKISLAAFLAIANNLKIGVTKENLQQLVSADNQDENAVLLRNYIANVTPTEIIFKGAESEAGALQPPPTADQSAKIVDQMAKRTL